MITWLFQSDGKYTYCNQNKLSDKILQKYLTPENLVKGLTKAFSSFFYFILFFFYLFIFFFFFFENFLNSLGIACEML